MRTSVKLAVAAIATLAASSATQAAALLSFVDLPISPLLPEFSFTPTAVPQLIAGPGAIGNGDGNAAQSAQIPGGLSVQTPFNLPLSIAGAKDITTGTQFDDVTVVLEGLVASADAATGPFNMITQPLGPAAGGPAPTITFFNTDLSTVLLRATINSAALSAINNTDTASVLSADLTYTSGVIYDALIAAGGTGASGGLSWSFLDVTNSLTGARALTINPATNKFVPFTANAVGLLNTPSIPAPTIPEPAGLTLLAAPAAALLSRRRRNA